MSEDYDRLKAQYDAIVAKRCDRDQYEVDLRIAFTAGWDAAKRYSDWADDVADSSDVAFQEFMKVVGHAR